MGIIQPGVGIPVRNAIPVLVPDREQEPDSEFVRNAMTRIDRNLRSLALTAEDITKPVDEYQGVSRGSTYPANYPTGVLTSPVGSVLNPGAAATIVSFTLPPARYSLTVYTYLSGTVAAGDANNMDIFWSAVQNNIPYPAVANNMTNVTFVANVPNNLGIFTIAASSAGGVTYNAYIVATAIGPVSAQDVSLTSLEVLPQYDTISERITSILVTGPPNSPVTLTIGNRALDVMTDGQGKFALPFISMLLTRNDRRLLNSPVPGNWTLELMGYADARF